jgi:hypothetical protein
MQIDEEYSSGYSMLEGDYLPCSKMNVRTVITYTLQVVVMLYCLYMCQRNTLDDALLTCKSLSKIRIFYLGRMKAAFDPGRAGLVS